MGPGEGGAQGLPSESCSERSLSSGARSSPARAYQAGLCQAPSQTCVQSGQISLGSPSMGEEWGPGGVRGKPATSQVAAIQSIATSRGPGVTRKVTALFIQKWYQCPWGRGCYRQSQGLCEGFAMGQLQLHVKNLEPSLVRASSCKPKGHRFGSR